jgi:hypothetical protein
MVCRMISAFLTTVVSTTYHQVIILAALYTRKLLPSQHSRVFEFCPLLVAGRFVPDSFNGRISNHTADICLDKLPTDHLAQTEDLCLWLEEQEFRRTGKILLKIKMTVLSGLLRQCGLVRLG